MLKARFQCYIQSGKTKLLEILLIIKGQQGLPSMLSVDMKKDRVPSNVLCMCTTFLTEMIKLRQI